METSFLDDVNLDHRLAERLRSLRTERGWSLDDLAGRSTISRATLSRLENGDVSPTASVLGKLCAAYGLTLSRLMFLMEDGFAALLPPDAHPVWRDPESGFERRSISPPAQTLAGEVLACMLKPGTRIAYERPPRPGLEHHLLLISGQLDITVDGKSYSLQPGDCLRYRLFGASAFATPENCSAHYYLFVV